MRTELADEFPRLSLSRAEADAAEEPAVQDLPYVLGTRASSSGLSPIDIVFSRWRTKKEAHDQVALHFLKAQKSDTAQGQSMFCTWIDFLDPSGNGGRVSYDDASKKG